MHSFGDWLRQIKGDTGKKKPKTTKCATDRQCRVYVGGMGRGRGLFKKEEDSFLEGTGDYLYMNKR